MKRWDSKTVLFVILIDVKGPTWWKRIKKTRKSVGQRSRTYRREGVDGPEDKQEVLCQVLWNR